MFFPSLALLLVTSSLNPSLTFASPLTHSPSSLAERTIPSDWSYMGCVAEPSGGARVLTTSISSSPGLTQESCIALCSNAGYGYAGMEFGTQCWCGNKVATPLNVLPDTSCSRTCGGNSGEQCGQAYILSLFGKTSLESTSSWSYVGCYSDASTRSLPYSPSSSTSMTNAQCQSSCMDAGYLYAGTENGSECWCSNSIVQGSGKLADSMCSSTCGGSTGTKCGGSWALSVYSRTLTPSWTSMGCYVDDGATRTMTQPAIVDYTMTVAKCQAQCAGYLYSGVEFGIDCYCSNTLTRNIKAPDSDCNSPCGGDSSSTCGGAYRLTLSSNL